MQVRTRHTPSSGVARLVLASAESVWVESSAMMATSYGVVAEPQKPGVLKSFAKAALGGDTPAVTTFTAGQQGGWVDVAPPVPGEVNVIELDGNTGWCLTKGAWLASSSSVVLDAQWTGLRGLFGGEAGFLAHLTGQGPVLLTCFGAVDVVTLQPGEFVTINTGHVVAYADTVQTRLRQASQGAAQSMRTGAGLVLDFAGPGQVYTQTRNPRAMGGWLRGLGFQANR